MYTSNVDLIHMISKVRLYKNCDVRDGNYNYNVRQSRQTLLT
jgi:hypothetical protein